MDFPSSKISLHHACILPYLTSAAQAFTAPPTVAADGAYSYFDGALLHYDLEHTADKYVSRTIFKAGNIYTGNGRAGLAVPPYHYHPYQDEYFEVVSIALYRCLFRSPRLSGELHFELAEERHVWLCRKRETGHSAEG